jgi:hypothetical protein
VATAQHTLSALKGGPPRASSRSAGSMSAASVPASRWRTPGSSAGSANACRTRIRRTGG